MLALTRKRLANGGGMKVIVLGGGGSSRVKETIDRIKDILKGENLVETTTKTQGVSRRGRRTRLKYLGGEARR